MGERGGFGWWQALVRIKYELTRRSYMEPIYVCITVCLFLLRVDFCEAQKAVKTRSWLG